MSELLTIILSIYLFVIWPISVILIFIIDQRVIRLTKQVKRMAARLEGIHKQVGFTSKSSEFAEEYVERILKMVKRFGENDAILLIKEDMGIEESQARKVLSNILKEKESNDTP